MIINKNKKILLSISFLIGIIVIILWCINLRSVEPKMTYQSQTQNPIQPQFRDIDGMRIRYARGGQPTGEQVVLLSPWPESIYAFLPIWGDLAKKFSLLAIDLPGFGMSESSPEVLAPEPMGDFIVKTIKAFGLERPHVVGPDVGTSALLFAAANHPNAFSSIVIGSGGVAYPLDITGALNLMVKSPVAAPFRLLSPKLFVNRALSGLKTYKVPDFVRQDYFQSYAGNRLVKSIAFVRAYPKALPVLKEKLSTIKIPVQIIWGESDQFVPLSNAHYLGKNLPNARLDLLKSGHFAWEDNADDYARIVINWVSGGCQNPHR